MQLAALAVSLTAWLRNTALDGQLSKAATKTLRYRLLSAPGRLVWHTRTRTLKIPQAGPEPATSPPPGPDSTPCTHLNTPPAPTSRNP